MDERSLIRNQQTHLWQSSRWAVTSNELSLWQNFPSLMVLWANFPHNNNR